MGFHLFFMVGKLTKVLINPRDIHYIWGTFSSFRLLFVAPVTYAPENRLNFDQSFFVCHMYVTKTHFRDNIHTNTRCASCVCTVEVKRHHNAWFAHNKCTLPGQTIIFMYLQEPSHIATDMRNITSGKGMTIS